MKLVKNWRHGGKWWSTKAHAANMAFLGTWAILPTKMQDSIPTWAVVAIAATFLVVGTVARFIDQGTTEEAPK